MHYKLSLNFPSVREIQISIYILWASRFVFTGISGSSAKAFIHSFIHLFIWRFIYLYFLFTNVLDACIMSTIGRQCLFRGQKRVLRSLELEFQKIVSYHGFWEVKLYLQKQQVLFVGDTSLLSFLSIFKECFISVYSFLKAESFMIAFCSSTLCTWTRSPHHYHLLPLHQLTNFIPLPD